MIVFAIVVMSLCALYVLLLRRHFVVMGFLYCAVGGGIGYIESSVGLYVFAGIGFVPFMLRISWLRRWHRRREPDSMERMLGLQAGVSLPVTKQRAKVQRKRFVA